jgi:hypothetical protein
LEHRAEACLAQRPPILLAELKGNSGINSVIGLLCLRRHCRSPAKIRTVGVGDIYTRNTSSLQQIIRLSSNDPFK